MNLDFKKIKPAHLLSLFGKQESEEAVAKTLALVGEDTTYHFTVTDLGNKGWYITDFLYNKYITRHSDGSYTVNQKLIDFIKSKEKQILNYMSRGDTYEEVLGMKNWKLPSSRVPTIEEAREYKKWLAHIKRIGLEEY